MKEALGPALIGAVAAAGIQPFTPAGWWLDSSRGVAMTVVVLAVLAAAIGVRFPAWPVRPRNAVPVAALWAGANIGMAIVLFSVGPGSIFPIVLAMGAGISAIVVAAGSFLGMLAANLLRRG